MKIDSITLHNFKCFEGTCIVNGLADNLTDQKRILLFGGLNGAGKTTLFEAILLCLYGKRNKTLWPSKGTKREDYQNYVVAVTNNNAKQSSLRSDLWIGVTLRDIELAGIPHSLSVKRSWVIDTQSNSLYKDGELQICGPDGNPFEFVSENDWEQFINELIPYEVSQFFFFDGEKIQDFVRDEDREFAESLEKVLGISLYEQLKNDLETVRRRILADFNKDEDAKIDLARIETEIVELEKQIRNETETVNRIDQELREIEEQIEEIELQTKRITRIQAQQLEEYRADKERLIEEKAVLEEKVFQAIQEDLPFVVTASLCGELIEQLENELKLNEFVAAQKSLEPKIQSIAKRLFEGEEPTPPLRPQQKKFYQEKLTHILNDTLAQRPIELANVAPLHNLSKNDAQVIEYRLQKTHAAVKTLSAYLERLQEIEPKLREISQAESKTDDPEAKRLYEERGGLQKKREIKQDIRERLVVEIQKHSDEISSKKSQRTGLEKRVERTLSRQKQMEYTRRLREVLQEFSYRLRKRKVSKLQEYTIEMWEKLAHKKDQIKSILINPDRQFSIELYDYRSRLIDKTKLSAGEKELLAISLIWALSRLANVNLPVVIDTPLGRLDTIHRENIARNYFSNASHQVILLSTNTEIVGKEYEAIKPFLSKEYLIVKDTAQKTSTISEGYFN
ncbi:MAG: DNA sulfur modification protein DndD [Candidatus Scalindua sp.]